MVDKNNDVAAFLSDPTGKTATNWKDEIYRTAVTQNHQVALNGGNQNTKFYAGVGYNKSEGIVLGSDFKRISARVNVDQKITDWADFSVKQMVAHTTQNGFRDQNDQAQVWVEALRWVSCLQWTRPLRYIMKTVRVTLMPVTVR